MSNDILKINWERGSDFIELSKCKIQNLITPFTKQKIKRSTLLTTGCANTNYLIQFDDGHKVIFRIYVRDHEAIPKERYIYQLAHETIPIPKILHSDTSLKKLSHPFALVEYKNGTNMRDIILRGDNSDIAACAFAAGKLCSELRSITLPYPGFFQLDGSIKPFSKDEEFYNFAFLMLDNDGVNSTLGQKLCKQVSKWIEEHQDCLTELDDANLSHADFDPANMLVTKINDTFEITALLDWEFSYSGSYLMDVGQFLRFSYKLPSIYKTNFIEGLGADGLPLPDHWELKSKALDLICLLSLLYFNPTVDRPNLNRDVCELIENTVITSIKKAVSL